MPTVRSGGPGSHDRKASSPIYQPPGWRPQQPGRRRSRGCAVPEHPAAIDLHPQVDVVVAGEGEDDDVGDAVVRLAGVDGDRVTWNGRCSAHVESDANGAALVTVADAREAGHAIPQGRQPVADVLLGFRYLRLRDVADSLVGRTGLIVKRREVVVHRCHPWKRTHQPGRWTVTSEWRRADPEGLGHLSAFRPLP